jgi:alpha-D-ribose 1-methylphosphonate 5-triphosphate synthase subunit PhnH
MTLSSKIPGQPSALTPTHATPHASDQELRARDTYLALMWSLSYPSRTHSLPAPIANHHAACVTIAASLLDLETSFYTPDARLAGELSRTGAQARSASEAAYHFYPTVGSFQNQADLESVRQARTGSYLYPDQSATLVTACHLGRGPRLRLSGPGILGESEMRIEGLPIAFWQLRAAQLRYPLGFDLFLVDGEQVVGLPRTTQIDLTRLSLEREI